MENDFNDMMLHIFALLVAILLFIIFLGFIDRSMLHMVLSQFQIYVICGYLAMYLSLSSWSYSERILQTESQPRFSIISHMANFTFGGIGVFVVLCWDACTAPILNQGFIRFILPAFIFANGVRVLQRELTSNQYFSSTSICLYTCAPVRVIAMECTLTILVFTLKFLVSRLLRSYRPLIAKCVALLQRCHAIPPPPPQNPDGDRFRNEFHSTELHGEL